MCDVDGNTEKILDFRIGPKIGLIRCSKGDKSYYCLGKYRNITGQHSHVILMTSARYGRMHTGRCIDGHGGASSLGCFSDELTEVDLLCSGRQRCTFRVADFAHLTTYPRDFASQLGISYSCLPGAQVQDYV